MGDDDIALNTSTDFASQVLAIVHSLRVPKPFAMLLLKHPGIIVFVSWTLPAAYVSCCFWKAENTKKRNRFMVCCEGRKR
jgi:uncharacterized membrane protein YesL